MDLDHLTAALPAQVERLRTARSQIDDAIPWYPYEILGNLIHLRRLLSPDNRDFNRFVQDLPVADIGAADGDLAFALEDVTHWQIDIIDTVATNMNGLRGARALREQLKSRVDIYDIDLDRQFLLPRARYGLVFLLGILYHLQNPFYVLHQLSLQASYCLLSTRVAQMAGTGDERVRIAHLPVAYLVGPRETNFDATNYWIFSPAGLEQLVMRAGWSVLQRTNVGDVCDSDPSSPDHDERVFMLLRSNN